MTRNLLITCVLLLVAAHVSAQAEPALVRHLPLNEAFVGDANFAFEVGSADRLGKLVVQVRLDAQKSEVLELVALRSDDGYSVRLPEARVQVPGFAYWVVGRMPDGSEQPVFADAQHAHHVRVSRTPDAEDEHVRLQRRHGKRSTVLLSGEGVDYGDRRLSANVNDAHDRYYRAEIGYAYSILTAVEDIRLSVTRVRGESGELEDGGSLGAVKTKRLTPGIDYGRAAVTLQGNDIVRFRGALLLGASQQGFEYGFGGALVLGDPFATNLDFGAETMTTLGTSVHLRMGFLAAPRIPMGAAVEVSSFPLGEDAGVRLLYDIGYSFDNVTSLVLRAGFQGRTSVTGGPSLGLAWEYGF